MTADKENMDPIHVKQGSTGSVDIKFLYRKPQCKVVSTANNIHKADILPLPRASNSFAGDQVNNGQLMLLADLSSKSEKIDIILGENPVRRNYDHNSSQDLADTRSIKRVKTESDSDSYTITMVKPTVLGETSHDDLVDEANIEAMDEVLNVNSNDVDLNVNSNDVVPNVNSNDVDLNVNSNDVVLNLNSNDVDRSQPNPFRVLYKNFVHDGSTTFLTVDNEHEVNEEVFGFSLIEALLNRDQSIVTVEVLVSEYLLFQAQYRQELIKNAGWLAFFFEFSLVIKK